MAPDRADYSPAYFETPELSERFYLVCHLVRNIQEILYIRAPEGGGKSRFAQRVCESLLDDYRVVPLAAGVAGGLSPQLGNRLGLTSPDSPDALLAFIKGLSRQQRLLLVVDDADLLSAGEVKLLFSLRELNVPLLLLGDGALAGVEGDRGLQFIDLPSFTRSQAEEFLAALDILLPDKNWYGDTAGRPGLLLALAKEKGASDAAPSSIGAAARDYTRYWLGAAIIFIVVLLGFQDEINQMIAGDELQPSVTEKVVSQSLPVPLIALPVQPEMAGHEEPPAVELNVPEPSVLMPEPDGAIQPLDGEVSAPENSQAVVVSEPPEELPVTEKPPSPVSAPMEEKASSTVAVSPSPPAAEKPVMKPRPVDESLRWLRAEPPQGYTLQLVGARERASVDQFIALHRLAGRYAVLRRDLNGQPWHFLVYGSYPDRDSAIAAREGLPQGIRRAEVWPRTFESLREFLPPQ